MLKKVVVLLPTYNEKENLAGFINQVFEQEKYIPGWEIEILVVDSHSPDGTYKLAEELAKKDKRIHVLVVGRGLGVALIEGHQYSIKNLKPDLLAQLDADGQVEVDVLQRLIKGYEDGYNLVLGSRFVKGGQNKLSALRKLFSFGASLVSRVLVGPFDIQEVTNSARAFTPELFEKINLHTLPWREQTFIVQPAFLHEAILAGAKYKEVPLVFKDRLEGYSKNKVFNYTYDVFAYSIEVFLHKLGINIPFFKMSRRAKTLVKFGLVGFTGTLIDFIFYKIFINSFGVPPATSKAFSTEIAIVNNFFLNNFWTFKYRKTNTNIYQKFGVFNLVSLGGLAIAVLIVKALHSMYGDASMVILGRSIAYNNFYFLATIPPVLIWNFTVNHYITWRHKKD